MKLDSLSFKNAGSQAVSCLLGPCVFWREGHPPHVPQKLDAAHPESSLCTREGWLLGCLAPDPHSTSDGPSRRDHRAPGESPAPGMSEHWLPSASVLFVRFPFSLAHQAAGDYAASWAAQMPLPQQRPPLISQRTRWKAGGVGRSFFCPVLICDCKAVIF